MSEHSQAPAASPPHPPHRVPTWLAVLAVLLAGAVFAQWLRAPAASQRTIGAGPAAPTAHNATAS
ncbi:hypothetical protein, partial [Lysobacter sp. 1R34A]|uniref:hypothetical protein n=1 Tax=Lysobacter sp. 1R34A TaxID=3445786 RepID=UPI003EE994D2